tara:strand:- start:85 stop:237 length:153 start_codon:yes stop_codon:yes gene_type:complete
MMNNWKKRITQTRLSDEPYPEAEIECEECEQVWNDTEDPACTCEDEEDEE